MALAIASATFVACNKDDDNNKQVEPTPTPTPAQQEVKIDGTWEVVELHWSYGGKV